MADGLTALALSLLGDDTQQAIRAENPYYRLQAVPNAVTQQALQLGAQSGRDNLGEALAWGVGSGLLSGLLGGAGDSYQQTLTDRYIKAAQTPGATAESSELPPGLFGKANRTGEMFRMQNALDQRASAQKFQQDRAAKLADLLAEQGFVVDAEGNRKQIFDPAEIAANKERAVARAKIEGENAAWNAPGENPNSPQAKSKKDLEERTTALRKELQGNDAFKSYEVSEKGYRTMLKALNDTSAVADLDFVYGAIQMIEPGMAVREGEQAAVANSTSIPESLKGALMKALNGEGRLTPDVRQAVVRLAQRRFDEHSRTFGLARNFYAQQAQRQGIDPGNISYMPPPISAQEIAKSLNGGGGDLVADALAEKQRRASRVKP